MQRFILATAVCVAFGVTLSPAGSATQKGYRACYSSNTDRALRLLRESVLRIERHGGERVFVSVPISPSKEHALTLGVAY